MSDARLAGISPWLDKLWDLGGTDLLLSPESAPRVRVDGHLKPIEGAPLLTGDQITDIALAALTDGQRAIFKEELDVDFAFSWLDRARIRGNMFTERGEWALAMRIIPARIPTYEELGLPPAADLVARSASWFRARHRPDGFGKIDVTRLNHRQDQRDSFGAHPHDRGPRGIRAPPPDVRRLPA